MPGMLGSNDDIPTERHVPPGRTALNPSITYQAIHHQTCNHGECVIGTQNRPCNFAQRDLL